MNYKYMSIQRLEEILNENYTRGVNGADYEEVKEELEAILWDKLQKRDEEELELALEEYNHAA